MKQVISIFLMMTVLAGCNTLPQPIDLSKTEPASDKGEPQDFPDIATGAEHSCLLTTTGRIECWSANQYGQLGGKDGPFTSLDKPPDYGRNSRRFGKNKCPWANREGNDY